MQTTQAEAVVAGHVCLDLIPAMGTLSGRLEAILRPGTLTQVGPAILATGGAVSNTGLALHRLGIATRLLGKIGDDPLGSIIRGLLGASDPALVADMIVAPGEFSSYSLVLSPAGTDRLFLHYSGTNDSYGAADIRPADLAGARVFHFGYPPLMRRLYSDGGVEMAAIFQQARAAGLTTSLDMVFVDPHSDAGRVDWMAWLERVLPHVDLYLPSLEETLFMLRRPTPPEAIDGPGLAELAQTLLDLGPALVGLKLGDQGLYVRTARALDRFQRLGACAPARPESWRGRELLAPCYAVEVAGTTGAGDCTIAGFLTGWLRGLDLEAVIATAVAVGACCVERPEATTGVPSWDALRARQSDTQWARRPVTLALPGWRDDASTGLRVGPHDRL